MQMPNEKPVVLPLTGTEVQDAILYKLAESMEKTCHLIPSTAYSAFSAEITVKIRLVDYGNVVQDNHAVKVSEQVAGAPEGRAEEHAYTLEIPEAPPNVVRTETSQEVPVLATEGGKQVIKKVRYAKPKNQPQQVAKKAVVARGSEI